jgi:prefoldin subunit 5
MEVTNVAHSKIKELDEIHNANNYYKTEIKKLNSRIKELEKENKEFSREITENEVSLNKV